MSKTILEIPRPKDTFYVTGRGIVYVYDNQGLIVKDFDNYRNGKNFIKIEKSDQLYKLIGIETFAVPDPSKHTRFSLLLKEVSA